MTPRSFRTTAATLVMTAALSGLPPSRVAAQVRPERPERPGRIEPPAPAAPTAPQAPRGGEWENAQATRERLRELLNQYPPSLTQVLRLDPSLLANQTYLAPYPTLAAFLAEHPDVAHNPSFFVGGPLLGVNDSTRAQTMRGVSDISVTMSVFLFFVTALGVVTYLARSVMDHRRWLHATRVQTDAHNKLFDRMASNDELLAYIQSPAGQRFLTSTAVLEPESRAVSAPIGRILWSMQMGVVLALAGVGLWVGKANVIEELAQPMQVVGTLAIAVGIGFVVSALLSWAISHRLGLIHSSSTHA
ncbi:MAG: hypothetical protein ACHQO8_11200 [Vicinamibacterales bacterium]